MEIGNIKDRKPWFVPKWLWNRAVDTACDYAKENLKVSGLASFVGDSAMDGLANAVKDKDPKTVESVAAAVSNGSMVFAKAADAVRDGVVTDEEKAAVGGALTDTVLSLVSQETIDAKIEEVRNSLLIA